MKRSPNVLIIQTAFLGDVILATALIESIRSNIPLATIDFVVRKGNEELLAGNPQLRKVFVWEKTRKYSSLLQLVKEFRKARYDYVINVQRFATTGLMTIFSGASMTIGFRKNPLSFLFTKRVPHEIGEVHEVSRNLKLIEAIGITKSERPRLYPSESQFEKVREYKAQAYITLSPASVWFTKQWPAEKWVEFLIHTSQFNIFLLGSSGDRAHCEEILERLPVTRAINLAGKISLLEAAALMKDARMNFVNDSAPLHLASAMNAPVTAIFCSTIPSFGFGPLSDQAIVVQTLEELSCRPCGLHGFRECPEGHFRCALSIRPAQLMDALA